MRINHSPFLNALEAYSYIVNNNNRACLPDVILLDLNMPFSGWSFLEVFKDITPKLAKPIDVIILTSSISWKERERAYTYDCVKGFFSKPFNQFLLKDITESSFLIDRVA